MTVLALTGVPGTGKTTVAEHLEPRFTVVDAGDLAREIGAVSGRDEARGSDIADEQRLAEHAREALPDGDVVVEGVVAHLCDPDLVVVLRCHPTELGRRLASRGWPEAKVEENVMAETLDAITVEVTDQPAWEIDTTDLAPQAVAEHIVALFTNQPVANDAVHELGGVDWTDTLLGDPAP